MNGYTPSRQAVSTGWTTYDVHEDKHRSGSTTTADASWLAGLVPSSYRQVLPLHNDQRRYASLHRLRKSILHRFPALSNLWTPTRSSLTRPQAESWLSTPSTDTLRFVLLCVLWYSSSALSSNTGKVILTQFRYPVTLTFVQFGFVAAFSLGFMSPVVNFSKLRAPTKAILRDTIPMGCFQVGGHIFSSMAISRIPVSTVHTIKVRARYVERPTDVRLT